MFTVQDETTWWWRTVATFFFYYRVQFTFWVSLWSRRYSLIFFMTERTVGEVSSLWAHSPSPDHSPGSLPVSWSGCYLKACGSCFGKVSTFSLLVFPALLDRSSTGSGSLGSDVLPLQMSALFFLSSSLAEFSKYRSKGDLQLTQWQSCSWRTRETESCKNWSTLHFSD